MALKHFHRNLDFAIYNGCHYISLLNMQTIINTWSEIFQKQVKLVIFSYENILLCSLKCPNETHPIPIPIKNNLWREQIVTFYKLVHLFDIEDKKKSSQYEK